MGCLVCMGRFRSRRVENTQKKGQTQMRNCQSYLREMWCYCDVRPLHLQHRQNVAWDRARGIGFAYHELYMDRDATVVTTDSPRVEACCCRKSLSTAPCCRDAPRGMGLTARVGKEQRCVDITTRRCHDLKEQLEVWNGNTIRLDHLFRFAPWKREQASGDGEAKPSSNRSPANLFFPQTFR